MVVIPADLVPALPLSELRVIVGHELAHHRRGDMWLSWIQLPISMIWWFHPAFWLLSWKMRSLREDCCDDQVVSSGLASVERYCETLLDAARIASGKPMAGASLAYIGESQPLRRRFKRIMSKKLITAPRLAWTGILIVVVLALLFLPGIRKRSALHQATPSGNESGAARTQIPANSQALPQAASLAGDTQGRVTLFRVLDASTGQPIENAALLVGPLPAVREMSVADAPHTDSDGRCSISVPAPPTSVVVRAATYVSWRLSFAAPEDYPAEYTFRLEKGSFIGGFVRDETGRPIAEVKLSVTASNPVLQAGARPGNRENLDATVYTRSDASGRWTADEVLPNPERIFLTLDHPDYGTARFTTEPVGSTPAVGSNIIQPVASASLNELKDGKAVLVMKSGLAIAGFVMDEYGNRIAGAEIRQFEKNPPGGVLYQPVAAARTDMNGRFLFRSLRPGEIVVAVQAKGFAPEHRTIKVEPRSPELVFRLAKGEVVRGRVIDDDGKPVEGAQISTVGRGADQPISWQGKTDADGRFSWDSAPVSPLRYNVSAEGFNQIDSMPLDSSREHEIRLSRGMEARVSGRVIDAKTRLPIESFKVTPLMPGAYPGWGGKPIAGKDGEFALTLSITRAYNGYSLLVEADGYLPDNSHTIDDKETSQSVEIALVPGGGYKGIVTFPDGSPVSGATVVLCGGNLTMSNMPIVPSMFGIRTINCSNASRDVYTAAAVTDESGRFSLKSVIDAHSVYATHEKGFAAVTAENLTGSSRIVLRPWGIIEGTLMVGSKPGAAQRVDLGLIQTPVRPPALRASFRTVTDNEGKFLFPTVLPGEYRASYSPVPMSGPAQTAFVAVKSGQTASVQIGGTGRPVMGRVVLAGAAAASFNIRYASLSLKFPGERIAMPPNAAAYRDWVEREEVRAQLRSERSISVQCAKDGSFRAEDVTAGTYTMTVTVGPMDASAGQSSIRLTKEIVVPEIPGGRSDTPLDLGILTFQIETKK